MSTPGQGSILGSPIIYGKVDYGPTHGQVYRPLNQKRVVTAAGNDTVLPFDQMVIYKKTVPAAFQVILPDVRLWMNAPYGGFDLIFVDGVGNAENFPITFVPFDSQTIDGVVGNSIMNTNGGTLIFVPLIDKTGWTLVESSTGTGSSSTDILDLNSYTDPVSGLSMNMGINIGATARANNVTVFKAANAYALANDMLLGHSGGTIEHTGTDSEGGNKVGLQITCKGLICSNTKRCAIVSYSTNYPALTLGHVDGASFGQMYVDGGRQKLRVGFGVDNSAQPFGVAIQFGGIFYSYINNLNADLYADQNGTSGAHNAYIGLYFPATAVFFFENDIPYIQSAMGAVNIFYYAVNSSGNRWGQMYIGGTTNFYVDYKVCSGPVFYVINGCFGTVCELNIEWSQAAIMVLLDNTNTFACQQMRLEGCRLSGFNPAFVGISGGLQATSIQALELYGCVIDGAATGQPTIFYDFGNCQLSVDAFGMKWNPTGGGTGDATVSFCFFVTPSTVGQRPNIRVGPGYTQGSTAAFFPDASISAATLGGILSRWNSYQYDPGQSRITEPVITVPSGNGSVTVYGCCARPQIVVNTPISADRKIILNNTCNSAGAGTGLPAPSEPLQVYRTSACTGAFNINVRDSGDTTTVVAMPTANTVKTITRNVTTLAAF